MSKISRKISSTHHMCMNIEGCLRNHKRKKIRIFSDENGNEISDYEARQYLSKCLSEGKRVIPMGSDCYRFDFQNGCPAHIKSLMPTDEKMIEIEKEYNLIKK